MNYTLCVWQDMSWEPSCDRYFFNSAEASVPGLCEWMSFLYFSFIQMDGLLLVNLCNSILCIGSASKSSHGDLMRGTMLNTAMMVI